MILVVKTFDAATKPTCMLMKKFKFMGTISNLEVVILLLD